MLTAVLLNALMMAMGTLYWTYVPVTPLLHPFIMSMLEVLVTSNYFQLLGFPWSESKQYFKLVKHTAVGQSLTICFLLGIVPMLNVFLWMLRLHRRISLRLQCKTLR